MAELLFHRLAKKEAQAAEAWYHARNSDAAARFRRMVERTANRIASAPDTYPFIRGQYRQLRVAGFPYSLIYRVRNDQSVLVVAVAHTSRRPSYWQRRK